ncbi:MAG: TonB family protein [Planctomycetes bacterium]|nr:TonB family protein [Planctomycetota bacterium]
MRSRFRTSLLIGAAAHALLFAVVGALYDPEPDRDRGASLLLVGLLAEEPAPPGVGGAPLPRVAVPAVWSPREAATPPSRTPAAQPVASRAPAPAAAAGLRLEPRATAPHATRPAPPPLLPAPAGGRGVPAPRHGAAPLVAIAHPAVEESVGIEVSAERVGAVGGGSTRGRDAPPTGETPRPEQASAAHSAHAGQAHPDQGADGPTTPAVLLNPSKPAYPRYCVVHEEEGAPVLSLVVRADGSVESIALATSSGNKRLDTAALEHYRNARFAPALRRGRPVASTHRIRVIFRLKDADAAAGD